MEHDSALGDRPIAPRPNTCSASRWVIGLAKAICVGTVRSRGAGIGGGEPSGSIGVQVLSADHLTLRYTLTQDGVARDVAERITITRTACPYGGARPWFHCPRCARRVAVLYMRQGYFACRHCQRVAYSSQSRGTIDRTWIKQRRIEARLGDGWHRPKGMRQRTYNALLDELADCEARRDEAFALVVKRFMRASDFGNGPGQTSTGSKGKPGVQTGVQANRGTR